MTLSTIIKKKKEEFVEVGADLEHDRWARWQKYMFSKGTVVTAGLHKGDLIIPAEFVDRWFRQIDTPYSELSEPEKESDRKETRSYLPLLEKAIRDSVEEALREVRPKFNYEYDGRSCFFEADFDSRVKEFMK